MKFQKLFEPMKIGRLELKNRVSMAPMGLSGLVTSEGGFTPRGIEYFVERARHGVGRHGSAELLTQVRQHRVGIVALAVHQAVSPALQPLAQGLKQDGHRTCAQK